ncbi:hypothetical protein [Aquibacillus halophilus]|uniref:hypothetical protein n=1 Tax=Aquibacillus halophilus TaxID=930132 RepID=UPI0014782A0C|nr:hypothetical protein [Aquibacillus halophilus]
MDKKKKTEKVEPKVAPGIDPDESYGENATETDMNKDDSTTVTRLSYDEYDPSDT